MKMARWLGLLVVPTLVLLAAPTVADADLITSPAGGIVVGNRGTGTFSVIDVATNQQTTITLTGWCRHR